MKNALICLLSLSLLVACGGAKKKATVQNDISSAVMNDFNKALRHLDKDQFSKASKILDKILVNQPTSEFDIIVLYNSALAYEGMKKCKKAVDRFRQVAAVAMNKVPRIEALALFRLSYGYECLGRDPLVVTSLLDAKKRRKYLAKDIARAELPARLAAAYLRVGNRKKANYYFKIAENGLRKLHSKKKDPVKVQALLSRTLFLMGRLDYSQTKEVDLELFVQHARKLQQYLLKSVELENAIWSNKAANQIVDAHKYTWNKVSELPLNSQGDIEVARQKLRAKQRRILIGSINNIEELRSMRFPDTINAPIVRGLFRNLDSYKRRYNAMLAQLAEYNRLTPQERRRQSIRKPLVIKEKRKSLLEKKRR